MTIRDGDWRATQAPVGLSQSSRVASLQISQPPGPRGPTGAKLELTDPRLPPRCRALARAEAQRAVEAKIFQFECRRAAVDTELSRLRALQAKRVS